MATADEQSRLAPGLTSSIKGLSFATLNLGTAEDAMAMQWKRPKPAGGIPHLACLPPEIHNTITALSDDMSLAIVSVGSFVSLPLSRSPSLVSPNPSTQTRKSLQYWNIERDSNTDGYLKVTCRALRMRLPHKVHVRAADEQYHPIALLSDEYYKPISFPIEDTSGDHLRHISSPLEDVIVVPGFVSVRRIKMHDLLKDYMKPSNAAPPDDITTELGSMILDTRGILSAGKSVFRAKYRSYAGNYGVFGFVTEKRYRELRDKYWKEFPPLPHNHQELIRKVEEEAKKAAEEENALAAQRETSTAFAAYLAARLLTTMGR